MATDKVEPSNEDDIVTGCQREKALLPQTTKNAHHSCIPPSACGPLYYLQNTMIVKCPTAFLTQLIRYEPGVAISTFRIVYYAVRVSVDNAVLKSSPFLAIINTMVSETAGTSSILCSSFHSKARALLQETLCMLYSMLSAVLCSRLHVLYVERVLSQACLQGGVLSLLFSNSLYFIYSSSSALLFVWFQSSRFHSPLF